MGMSVKFFYVLSVLLHISQALSTTKGIFLTEKIIWTEYMALHFDVGCCRKLAFISLFTLKLFSHFAMGPG